MTKYPRTRHLQGSRRQPGDEDLEDVPWSVLQGRYLVVEEKVDGANAGLSFREDGELQLQSRGHYLTGGGRERHFQLFKTWASCHQSRLHEVLGTRYLLFGEWLYAKHTVFYDRLPHYFLEFDVLDQETGEFLSTARRQQLLRGLPVASVPVLHQGQALPPKQLWKLVTTSLFKSPEWKEKLALNRETDPSDEAEGLYLKVEEEGRVTERLKLIRPSFLTSVVDSGSHWLDRPIVPNLLAPDVDIFAC